MRASASVHLAVGMQPCQADGGIGFIDGAIGVDAGGMLGDAGAVAERGFAGIAGLGVDLRQDDHHSPLSLRTNTNSRISATATACAMIR